MTVRPNRDRTPRVVARRPAAFVVIGVLLVLGASALVERIRAGPDPYPIAEGWLERVREVRSRLEGCRATQDRIEMRFAALEAQVASLRSEIDTLESLDPRGIPTERYAEYLALVETFNTAVEAWEPISEDLIAQSERCRVLARDHNATADSLRGYLLETGIWTEVEGLPEELDGVGEREEGPPAVPGSPPEGSLPRN